MSRSRRRQAASTKSPAQVQRAAPATLDDAIVVTKVADAAVRAIRETAAGYGLDGPSWDADLLHPQVAPIVARALRASEWWWAGRTDRPDLEEPGDGPE